MTATRIPVVFVHGLWLHATSWAPWTDLFTAEGYDAVAYGWPHEPATVDLARADPQAVANTGIDQLADHYESIIASLHQPPIVVGHSFGGLIAQKLLARGVAAAAVAIDPAQMKGVLPLPWAQLRAGSPALANPLNRTRSIVLTAKQFRYGFGNAVGAAESDELHARWTIPSPARPLFEAAVANFRRHSPAAIDTANSTRGPLLMISGGADHTVPDVVTRASFARYRHSKAVTELQEFPDRGHSLVVDSGWTDIAKAVLVWLGHQGL